jgi:hypothetical protein
MTTKLNDFLREHATVKVSCEPEYMHPKDCFDDAHDIAAIVEKAEWNEWAWCCICVKVTFQGLSETEHLGCCSYDSEKDFIISGDYYEDMLHNCLATLETRLIKLHETVSTLTIND